MTSPDPTLEVIRELYAHMWEVRTALIHAIGRTPWEKVSKPEPPFKRSIVDATVDLFETEAYWAHHVLDNGVGEWKAYDRANVTSAERLAFHASGVERATAERLAVLPPAELSKTRSAPAAGTWTAADVLLRPVTTNLAECGFLAARVAALGVTPQLPSYMPTPM